VAKRYHGFAGPLPGAHVGGLPAVPSFPETGLRLKPLPSAQNKVRPNLTDLAWEGFGEVATDRFLLRPALAVAACYYEFTRSGSIKVPGQGRYDMEVTL
jgi:hypothetical protein